MNEIQANQALVLQQAITALEAQRATLGDAVVEASLVALRAQLAQLENASQQRTEAIAPRLMTCLVANLVTRDKDPSRGLKILDHGFHLVAETARAYGGTVQGVRGNYLVALFSGAADDPARAAHAALEMRQKLLEFSLEREKAGHGSLTFRAGLNIGTVAPGISVPKGETGTIDVAGVLSQYSPPNAILVSQQMHAYIGDGFNFQNSASVEIGRKRIATYRLIDARQAPLLQQRRGVSLEAPFLGRSSEMRAMLKQIEQFSVGQGGVIVVAGESGLGKTRLVTEVRGAAPMIHWLDARCQTSPIKLVFGAWNDLLLRLIDAQAIGSAREIDKKLHDWLNERNITADCYPFLANQLGLAVIDDDDPERVARQTAEAWQALLGAVVRQRPTVIVFEEAEAMDSSSLALFEKLVESFESYPVVWMLVTQPLYNQPAAATITRLARRLDNRYMYLGLEPIGPEDSLSLLYAVLDVQDLPDPLQAGILERATGNPLFLQQIVRALIDRRGLVVDPQGRWGVTAAALQEHMPWNLRDVVLQRVRTLPGDAQELLQLIAVVDDVMLPGLLRALPSTPNLEGLINLLRDGGFLGEGPTFMHPTLRENIYQAIAKPQRAAMHRQVTAALAASCELGGPWLAIRAYHMDKGAQTQSALTTYEEAKMWAYANNALAEASDIIGATLELLHERDTPEQVASLLVEQQDILYQLDPTDSRCKLLLERAYELWSSLGDTSEAAAVLLRMAIHYAGTPQEDAYYRDAQSLLERDDAKHPMLPSVYLRRALYAANQGPAGQSIQTCNELFDRARTLALQLQDVDTLAHIHFEMGLYLRNHHQLSEALAAFQQALSYFSQLEQSSPDERVLTCNYLADLYYHLGQPADGEYFAMEAASEAPRTSDMIQVLPYITLSECYAAQARWQDALRSIEEAPASLAPPELPPRFWLGRWQFESGDTLGGLETMREALPTENLECLMLFIDYLLEASFSEEASIRLHQLVKQGRFNDPNTTVPAQAVYDRLRGRLASASKDYSRAVSLLDRAMRQFDRESFVLLGISTRRVYAAALLGRCNAGDEQAALSLINESISWCKRLSIHAESRRLQDALRAHWPDRR